MVKYGKSPFFTTIWENTFWNFFLRIFRKSKFFTLTWKKHIKHFGVPGTGSTIRTLLRGKINPKDWQVINLGDVGFPLFLRVVSGDYGKPWKTPLFFLGLVKTHQPTHQKLPGRKFHLSGVEGPKIGLFLPKSHDVFEAAGCPAHHPAINEALEASVTVGFKPS